MPYKDPTSEIAIRNARLQTARSRARWEKRIDDLPKIACACGCGTMIPPINRKRQPAKFAQGHWAKANKGKLKIFALAVGLPQAQKGKTGAKHPAWKGCFAPQPYPKNWHGNRKFKESIRERDDHTCQRCGITQAEYGTKALDVHHLDHDKSNLAPSNLITACHKCNMWASSHRNEPFQKTG